jgi:CheY-like chemotaxis protein
VQFQDVSADAPVTGIRVLVADDDPCVLSMFASLLRATNGVATVYEAEDGVEAVELSRKRCVDVVVLDLNMPGFDGVEAALRLCGLEPSPRIALHSSDPELLRQRAAGLGLPLFDKIDFEQLLAWVERQATERLAREDEVRGPVAHMARKVDLCCSQCGYGVVCRTKPVRCPMCGRHAAWIEPPGWTARRAALRERLAG